MGLDSPVCVPVQLTVCVPVQLTVCVPVQLAVWLDRVAGARLPCDPRMHTHFGTLDGVQFSDSCKPMCTLDMHLT